MKTAHIKITVYETTWGEESLLEKKKKKKRKTLEVGRNTRKKAIQCIRDNCSFVILSWPRKPCSGTRKHLSWHRVYSHKVWLICITNKEATLQEAIFEKGENMFSIWDSKSRLYRALHPLRLNLAYFQHSSKEVFYNENKKMHKSPCCDSGVASGQLYFEKLPRCDDTFFLRGQSSIRSPSGNSTMVFPLGNHCLLVSVDGRDLIPLFWVGHLTQANQHVLPPFG